MKEKIFSEGQLYYMESKINSMIFQMPCLTFKKEIRKYWKRQKLNNNQEKKEEHKEIHKRPEGNNFKEENRATKGINICVHLNKYQYITRYS